MTFTDQELRGALKDEDKWPDSCPICGARTKWKISGTGKHYGQLCSEHGFVGLRKNPLIASASQKKIPAILKIMFAALNFLIAARKKKRRPAKSA